MEKSVSHQFNQRILLESARRFSLNTENLDLISDVENFVYKDRIDESSCILRITHSSHRTLEAILGELDWMEYLSANQVSVTQPCRSINGKLVEVIDTNDSHFLVTAFQRIPGKTILDAHECTPEIYRQWGMTMGSMHALVKLYEPHSPTYRRAEWFEDDLVCNAEAYLPSQQIILDKYQALINHLLTLRKDKHSYGLIHADFTDVNFFVNNHKITVFDFDDCIYHWFVYDIAVILYDCLPWLPNGEMNKDEFASYFWGSFNLGYKQENSLEPYWLDQLNLFCKLREIILYVVAHKKWDMENLSQARLEYLSSLKRNIENEIPYLNLKSLFG